MAEKVERRLAAILCADVAAYSRLVREDEERTLAAVKADIVEIFEPGIASHRGRIFKTMGDAVLAEFTSVVDAVRCAVELQRNLVKRNVETPADRQIEFRMGVNLGDVVIDGSDVHGDGVNVAARVQDVAEPGGICISEDTYRHLSGRIEVGYKDLGPLRLKKFDKPVRVYRIESDPVMPGRVVVAMSARLQRWKWPAATAIVALVALLAAGHFGVFPIRVQSTDVEPARPSRMAFALPDKPSIAVLPFDNLSADAKNDVISDGLTEDIITSLSKISTMFVIARNSTFTYKGKPVKVQQVAEELGVRYVLEGSVQRSGEQLRMTAQLIDATTGRHLWSERYDREVQEIFALQDEITKQIVAALEVKLTAGKGARVAASGTKNVKAWELVREGETIHRRFSKENNAQAREIYKRAIELDPEYALAWAQLGATHFFAGRFQWSNSADESFERAIELSKKALSLDDALSGPHGVLSLIYLFQRRHDEAIAEGERAVALSPNTAQNYSTLGFTLAFTGRHAEAIALLKKAMRLSPYYPDYMVWMLGMAHTEAGQYEEAVQILKSSLERNPNHFLPYVRLAAAFSEMGREAEARAAAAQVLRINPNFTITYWERVSPYKDVAAWARHRNALLIAGLPE